MDLALGGIDLEDDGLFGQFALDVVALFAKLDRAISVDPAFVELAIDAFEPLVRVNQFRQAGQAGQVGKGQSSLARR